MKKILTLALAVVLVAISVISCGPKVEPITVALSFKAGNDLVFTGDILIEAENPSVVDLVNEAVIYYGVDAEISEDGRSVKKVSYYYNTDIDGLAYYWQYTINGVAPETGTANTNYVKDGDKVEYTFVIVDPETEKVVTDNALIELFTYTEEELQSMAESESIAIAESESLAAEATAEEETIDMSEFLEEEESED